MLEHPSISYAERYGVAPELGALRQYRARDDQQGRPVRLRRTWNPQRLHATRPPKADDDIVRSLWRHRGQQILLLLKNYGEEVRSMKQGVRIILTTYYSLLTTSWLCA